VNCRIAAVAAALAASLVGCASSAWRHARSDDSITGYHTFLEDYPDSRFSEQARARLELARIKKRPTRAGAEAFRAKYSDPELVAELAPFVEELLFRHARAVGTTESYREFVTRYPSGALSTRATGNLSYLEHDGFGGNLEALAKFAEEYPTSDYASEARRSVAGLRLRGATAFDRVGVVVDVNAGTPGADRLRRVFRDRAAAAYAAAGMKVEAFADADSARASDVGAILTIRHEEREVSAELEKGTMTEPAIVARTEVDLERVGGARTTWSDSFEYRVPLSARRDDDSILFSAGSHSSYWADSDGEFFVPVARWSTEAAARHALGFSKPVRAVDVAGTRAVVLFGDGDFQVYDFGDPERLDVVADYRRNRDLARFEGVRIDRARVAIFGTDGIELVVLDGEQARRERVWGREKVGTVNDAEVVDGKWLVATSRGLLRLDLESESVETLVARPIVGMARASGDRLVFTDGVSLYVATLASLQSGSVEGELRLGRGFAPQRIRARGRTAVVIGARDAVWIDVDATPRVISRINGKETGKILDASTIGDRLFLIGPRGLQVADSRGERIVDSVDVEARRRVEAAGRHLVIVGEKSLQVVDATPFVTPPPGATDGEPRGYGAAAPNFTQ
jgi:hypothetical protein